MRVLKWSRSLFVFTLSLLSNRGTRVASDRVHETVFVLAGGRTHLRLFELHVRSLASSEKLGPRDNCKLSHVVS